MPSASCHIAAFPRRLLSSPGTWLQWWAAEASPVPPSPVLCAVQCPCGGAHACVQVKNKNETTRPYCSAEETEVQRLGASCTDLKAATVPQRGLHRTGHCSWLLAGPCGGAGSGGHQGPGPPWAWEHSPRAPPGPPLGLGLRRPPSCSAGWSLTPRGKSAHMLLQNLK